MASGVTRRIATVLLALRRMLDSKREITAYLQAKAAITARATTELASKDQWEKVRPKRLEEMRDMFGILQWPWGKIHEYSLT